MPWMLVNHNSEGYKGTVAVTRALLKAASLAQYRYIWIIDDNVKRFEAFFEEEGCKKSVPLTKHQFESYATAAERAMTRETAVACCPRSTEKGHHVRDQYLVSAQADRAVARSRALF